LFFEVRPVLSSCGKDLLDSLAVVFHGVADRFDGQSQGQVGGRKVAVYFGILGAGFRSILNWLFTGADIRDQQAGWTRPITPGITAASCACSTISRR
jgi:hypothetical protein